VLDARTGVPIEAQVALGQRAMVTGRDEGSFEFDSVAPPGPYTVNAAAKGFLTASTRVGVTAGTVSLIDIRLTPEPGGAAPKAALPAIVPSLTDLEHEAIYFGSDKPDLTFEAAALLYDVPTVYFLPGKADVTPEAAEILRVHANLLKSNPSIKMTILGRADAPGPVDPAARLAEQRAVATFEYLKSLGVPAGQLVFRGVEPPPAEPGK
jgi:outer membrane protein OmpA-like peptidoglycan-associated protein